MQPDINSGLQSGSQEHLETFANNKLKNYFENKWDTEINVLLETAELKRQQEKLHQTQVRFNEAQEQVYPSAKEGKKALDTIQSDITQIEEDITALTNMIIRDTEAISNHSMIIEKTQQWVKDNGTTSDNN